MCRFALIKSQKPIKPKKMLYRFAEMAKASCDPGGDTQKDGWGIAWLDENNQWQVYKSLSPVWEDINTFDTFPKTSIFLLHARSAFLPQQKNIIAFNQPYINEKYAFVFNGLLRKVSLTKIPGRIGSEKIWSLLMELLDTYEPEEALKRLKKTLIENSQNVIALNIGLSDKKNIYALCYYTEHPDYYALQYINKKEKIICSEQI